MPHVLGEQTTEPKGYDTSDILVVIPARLNSTRVTQKLLQPLDGIPIIRRTIEQIIGCGFNFEVVLVTDSEEICSATEGLAITTIYKKKAFSCGTDRVASILPLFTSYEYIINVQGDQPFVEPFHVYLVGQELYRKNASIVSVMSDEIYNDANPNRVKVSVDDDGNAISFSRENQANETFLHVGIYGFERNTLSKLSLLPQTENEKTQRLEQLRWIDHGYTIKMIPVPVAAHSIDSSEDL